ncbi:MAG: type II toxin-antitoxin system VapC family toxin [Proteobacteria bacterium]|nr:type II toxin-antitoxin system VapC family toxin [Pseudomonadota bacterium]
MGYIIDTCIWIDVEQAILTPEDVAKVTGNELVFLSPVTIAELKYGADISIDPEIRELRLSALRKLYRKPLLSIDDKTGEIFGGLAAKIRISGKSIRYRVQDLWLASQAIQHDCKLLTHNGDDFKDIPGLALVIWNLRG